MPTPTRSLWLPDWAWTLLARHFRGFRARPAVRWMNRFAFLGIVIGVFAWTAVISVMAGLQGDRKERILKEKPHLLWEGTPRQGLEAKSAELAAIFGDQLKGIKFILQTEGLIEVTSRKQQGRITGSGIVLQGIEGLGGDVEVGAELARSLGLGVDESLRVFSAWRLDLPPMNVEVAKFFETGVYELDRAGVRVDRMRLETWLGLNDAVSRVEIQIQDPTRAPEFLQRVSEVMGVPFLSWRETEASLWYSLRLEMIVISVAVFFVVLIAAFAVHLALSVRVADKTREIGLLRALGAEDKILSRLYLSEGAILGVTGSAVGLLVSWIFCQFVSGYVKLPAFYYYTSIPVRWNWSLNLGLCAVAVLLCLIASWWPAQRVRSIEVQEALRS